MSKKLLPIILEVVGIVAIGIGVEIAPCQHRLGAGDRGKLLGSGGQYYLG